jgi:hypothetical protein
MAWRVARVRVRAAIAAAIAAGVVSTGFELALWSLHGDPLPATLWRDTRFAAAMLMGPRVLPPPATFDATVMAAAATMHFALSIVYALMLAPFVTTTRRLASATIGASFGALVYLVNMYGFTALFPWFEATRDPITLAAHAVFGACAAIVYRIVAGEAAVTYGRRAA